MVWHRCCSYRYFLIILAYPLLTILGAGNGLIASSLVRFFPETEKLIPPIMRPVYFF